MRRTRRTYHLTTLLQTMIALDIIAKLKTHNVAPKLVGDQLKLIGDVKSLPADVINLVRAHKEEVIVFLSETRDT